MITHRERTRAVAIEMARTARFLLCSNPVLGEHFHTSMKAISEYEARSGSLNEKWYRCGGLGHGYIRAEQKTRSGRIVWELPPDVLASDVIEISHDLNARPLLNRMQSLADEIERTAPGKLMGMFQNIVAAVSSPRSVSGRQADSVEFIRNTLARISVCYGEDYEAKRLFETCQRGLACLGSPDLMRRFTVDTVEAQFGALEKFETTGNTLAQLLAAFHVALMFDDGKTGGSTGSGSMDYQMSLSMRPFNFTGVFFWLMFAPQGAFEFYFNNLLARAAQAGFIVQIAAAAERLRSTGDQLLHDAKEANDYENSQRLLLWSMPWLRGGSNAIPFSGEMP